jgi:hypothetical protein
MDKDGLVQPRQLCEATILERIQLMDDKVPMSGDPESLEPIETQSKNRHYKEVKS